MPFTRRDIFKALTCCAAYVTLPKMSAVAADTAPVKRGIKSDLPVLKCDVIVVGAGASGIPSAIAAAREGAKVILLEEDMMPGGAPVDMYVTYMCGAPRVGIYLDTVKQLNREYSLSVTPSETIGNFAWDGKQHWWLPSSYSIVFDQLIEAEKDITLMCGCQVVDTLVKARGNRNTVYGVVVARGGRTQMIEAPVTIDATGSGLVSVKAGCEYFYGSNAKSDFNESIGLEKSDSRVQPCTQMFISERVKRNAVYPRELFRSGMLDHDHKLWASQQTDEEFEKLDSGIYLHWGATIECPDTTDPFMVAEAQRQALKELRPKFKALHDAGYATHMAPKIGVRECRRIKGETVITVDDIINRVQPDDKIADAWYSLDAWGMQIDPAIRDSVGPYGIPFRSLIPVNTDGLLTAGRIISGTRLAMSSYRVQPICSTIGEAAGTAAAMIASEGIKVRDLDVRKLQDRLDEKGLFDWYRNISMQVNNKPWMK
jgi:hypothetical protein